MILFSIISDVSVDILALFETQNSKTIHNTFFRFLYFYPSVYFSPENDAAESTPLQISTYSLLSKSHRRYRRRRSPKVFKDGRFSSLDDNEKKAVATSHRAKEIVENTNWVIPTLSFLEFELISPLLLVDYQNSENSGQILKNKQVSEKI